MRASRSFFSSPPRRFVPGCSAAAVAAAEVAFEEIAIYF